jgi:hypothetical protein
MTKTNTNEGWVVVHPDGRLELNFFWTQVFKTKLDDYTNPVTPEFWRNAYRPDCTLVRMRLVPSD